MAGSRNRQEVIEKFQKLAIMRTGSRTSEAINRPVVGVLALQGCIEPHERLLAALRVPSVRVRRPEDLQRIDCIILPGGESTTMLRLLKSQGLFEPLRSFGQTHPVWGICAGSILLAAEVASPSQDSLALMDIRATRNFYGSQINSFSAEIEIAHFDAPFNVDFIRAPRLEPLPRSNSTLQVLARHDGRTIMLQQGHLLASAFHIELGDDTRLHEYFLTLAAPVVRRAA